MLNLYNDWIAACLKRDYPKIIKNGEAFNAMGKEEQEIFLKYAMSIFRNLLLSRYEFKLEEININPIIVKEIKKKNSIHRYNRFNKHATKKHNLSQKKC